MREKQDAFIRFDNEVNQIQNRILNSMDRYESALLQTRGFLLNSKDSSRETFKKYVENIEIFERYPGAQGIGLTVRIDPKELNSHIKEEREKGIPDYHVWPMSPREDYFSILYLEPMDWRNRRAIGFDMFNEPIRREAMVKARDSGRAALSGKVVLVQETSKNVQSGFNLYLPVYKKNSSHDDLAERKKFLYGFIYMPFRANDFFKEIFIEKTRLVSFKVYDGTNEKEEDLLYAQKDDDSNPLFSSVRKLELAQHSLLVRFSSLPGLQSFVSRFLPFISAFIGLLITYLVANIKKSSLKAKSAIEESLISSEKLKLVSDQTPALVAYLNLDETYAWVNKAYETFYHSTLRSFIGKKYKDSFEEEIYKNLKPHLDGAINGKHTRFEITSKNASDELRSFLVDFVPDISAKKVVRGVVSFASDITDQVLIRNRLMESEFHFRRFADSINQLAWIADPQGKMTWTNKRWLEYTGVDSDFINNGGWKEVIHPDHRDDLAEFLSNSWLIPESWETTVQLKSTKDEWRWFLIKGVPITNEKNEIIQWLGTSTDVTDHMETEESLKAALKTRDNFLSIASHELKTPITSLLIQIQMFSRSIDKGDMGVYRPERVNKLIDMIGRQISRLTRLIDDMLDVSRIQSGKLKIEKEEFDLKELVEEILARLENNFMAAGIPLPTLHFSGNTKGYWDRLRIEQVVVNLLTNALRYGDGKPISVYLEGKDKEVTFKVIDQGRGIDAQFQEKIFNRFERAIEHKEVSGLGLGLFISKQIVEEHAGKIWVESVLGKGATFVVLLPK